MVPKSQTAILSDMTITIISLHGMGKCAKTLFRIKQTNQNPTVPAPKSVLPNCEDTRLFSYSDLHIKGVHFFFIPLFIFLDPGLNSQIPLWTAV